MNKAIATAKALDILNQNGDLFEDERTFRIISRTITELVDELGPTKALEQVRNTKAHMLNHINILSVNHKR